jgi:hypothetical protein
MLKRLLSLGAAALSMLVAGCGDGPSTVPSGVRNAATWSSLVYATRSGPLLLEVKGNPFGTSAGGFAPSGFAQAVAESMSGAIPGQPFRFVTVAEQAAQPRFRVVVAFDTPPAAGGRIGIKASFRDGDSVLSAVNGWVARVEQADDPRFRLLLGQTVRDLMGEP